MLEGGYGHSIGPGCVPGVPPGPSHRVKSRMADVEGELGSAVEKDDQALAGLIGMVNKVMVKFDDQGEGKDEDLDEEEERKFSHK